jgi:hypothetical protein
LYRVHPRLRRDSRARRNEVRPGYH